MTRPGSCLGSGLLLSVPSHLDLILALEGIAPVHAGEVLEMMPEFVAYYIAEARFHGFAFRPRHCQIKRAVIDGDAVPVPGAVVFAHDEEIFLSFLRGMLCLFLYYDALVELPEKILRELFAYFIKDVTEFIYVYVQVRLLSNG